jgi:hypothetical protein
MLATLADRLWSSLVPDPFPADDDDAPRVKVKRFISPEDFRAVNDNGELIGIHYAQQGFVEATERECMLLVGRQGGKTSGCLMCALKCAMEKPKSRILYICFDLDAGRELFYEAALEKLQDLGWAFKATQTPSLRIKLENGSVIVIKSADDLRSAGRLRGRNWDLIFVDEIQELPSEVAKKLVVDVIGPMMFRRRGRLVLAFTPPEIQHGWLWDEFKSGRWRLFQWAQNDNPWLPPGEDERWLKARGLTMEHPIAKRELRGLWEPNVDNFVFGAFNELVNVYEPDVEAKEAYAKAADAVKSFAGTKLEQMAERGLNALWVKAAARMAVIGERHGWDPKGWRYATGVDIGWQHHDSICLLAWHRHDPLKRVWEVLTWKQNHMDIDQLFRRFYATWKHHRPMVSNIMDQAGAGGQKVVATVENRFQESGLPVEVEYKPTSVVASVGLVNDKFRVGQLVLRSDSPLLEELVKTVWKLGTNRQEIDKAKFDPHGLDSLRYALWGASNYRSKGKEPEREVDYNADLDARLDAHVTAEEW